QYRVAAEDEITVMTLPGEPGDVVAFDVLALFDGETSQIGAPLVEGASVAAEIVSHGRGPKVIAFKKRRRKNSRRKRGHKQDLTIIKITDILTGGAKAAPRAEAAEVESATAPPAPCAQPAGPASSSESHGEIAASVAAA